MNLDLTKICDVEVDNIKMYDAWDFVDAYISSAWYDLGNKKFRELTEEELNWVTDNHPDFVYEKVMNHIF